MKRIILGSASPRRRELLQLMGVKFEVLASEAEEHYHSILPPDIVKELALMKAQNVSELLLKQASWKEDICVVIGADTIVVKDGQIMGKPKSQEDAFEMIKSLQGRTHEVYTGVALLECSDKGVYVRANHAEETKVFVHEMEDWEIREYISSGEAMDKAGAYAIQGSFAVHISKIDGNYNSIMGLPISKLYDVIKKYI